jgi:hypothetical protein
MKQLLKNLKEIFTIAFCLYLLWFSQSETTYPKITGYVSVMHPIVTLNKDHTTTNFDGYYQVVFPVGINVWKSSRIGFSIELAPV